MIYIITALKAEASHFIAYYKLVPCLETHFTCYENKHIKLIVSGIGKVHAASATTYLLQKFPHDTQHVFNIGTATSTQPSIMIGSLHPIRKIIDLSTAHSYHIAQEGETLTCVDKALSFRTNIKTPLADMESVGVYLAAKHFTQDINILKIVSDHTADTIPQRDKIHALFMAQSDRLKEYLDV